MFLQIPSLQCRRFVGLRLFISFACLAAILDFLIHGWRLFINTRWNIPRSPAQNTPVLQASKSQVLDAKIILRNKTIDRIGQLFGILAYYKKLQKKGLLHVNVRVENTYESKAWCLHIISIFYHIYYMYIISIKSDHVRKITIASALRQNFILKVILL